jgi:hypothetical protein
MVVHLQSDSDTKELIWRRKLNFSSIWISSVVMGDFFPVQKIYLLWNSEKIEYHCRQRIYLLYWWRFSSISEDIHLDSKNESVESTFLRRRINVNSHTLSFYESYSWFNCILHRFYVSGVFYGKNNYLSRRRLEPTTVRTNFWHKNTKPHPSVHGYSNSWKMDY